MRNEKEYTITNNNIHYLPSLDNVTRNVTKLMSLLKENMREDNVSNVMREEEVK
jgi:hypothetical protein